MSKWSSADCTAETKRDSNGDGFLRYPRQSVSFTDSKVDAVGFGRGKFLERSVFPHALSTYSFMWLPTNT